MIAFGLRIGVLFARLASRIGRHPCCPPEACAGA